MGYNFIDLSGGEFPFTNEIEIVNDFLIIAPFGEYSVELVFEINEKLDISISGQFSCCSFEYRQQLDSNQNEKVNYHN